MKNRKQTIIILVLTILMLIIMSGCTIIKVWMYDDWVERAVGSNSICWEDNDNVIVYCSLTWCYNEAIGVSETTKIYEIGGELWRINANTGATELLLRKKGGKYHTPNPDRIRIEIANKHIYISDEVNTYKVKDDYNGWDSIGYFIIPNVSKDERYIVARDQVDGTRKTVKKYDMINNTNEILFTNDEFFEWLDYDYSRNYLLVNNNKFIDLNTGEEKALIHSGDTILSRYYMSASYVYRGNIGDDYITVDVVTRDIEIDSSVSGKVFINSVNFNEEQFVRGLKGFSNPSRTKYASGDYHSVLITDTLGNLINSIVFDSDKL